MTPLTSVDLPSAGTLLARAFDQDPFFLWLLPDAREREVMLEAVMRSNVELAIPRGAAAGLADPDLRGVCLWFAPGRYPPSRSETLTVRGRAAVWAARQGFLGVRTVAKALRIGELMEEAHPSGDYYYLQVLAVDPAHQGRGAGSAMLRESVAKADRAGQTSVLETSNPINVKLYRRFGFEIVHTMFLDSSPPLWTMRRAPASLS